MPKYKSRETMTHFTERAMRAAESGALVPPMVYVPVNLRKRATRLTIDDRVTINPATDAENDLRVSQADPTGLLIAMMQGQPIPTFELGIAADGTWHVKTTYQTAPLPLRASCAGFLIRRSRGARGKNGDKDFDALVSNMAEPVEEI